MRFSLSLCVAYAIFNRLLNRKVLHSICERDYGSHVWKEWEWPSRKFCDAVMARSSVLGVLCLMLTPWEEGKGHLHSSTALFPRGLSFARDVTSTCE